MLSLINIQSFFQRKLAVVTFDHSEKSWNEYFGVLEIDRYYQ